MHELVDSRHAAQYRPVADMNMTGKLHAVGENGVRAHLAVMRNMHVGHDPVVVAHARHTDVLRRTRVIVTNSRTILPSPISRRVGSLRYFLSCGMPPMEQ